jgi:hypothetical protein
MRFPVADAARFVCSRVTANLRDHAQSALLGNHAFVSRYPSSRFAR